MTDRDKQENSPGGEDRGVRIEIHGEEPDVTEKKSEDSRRPEQNPGKNRRRKVPMDRKTPLRQIRTGSRTRSRIRRMHPTPERILPQAAALVPEKGSSVSKEGKRRIREIRRSRS